MISNNNSDDKRLKIAMKRYQMINSLVEEGIDKDLIKSMGLFEFDVMPLYIEKNINYIIIDEFTVNDQSIVLGHNKDSMNPYVTWKTDKTRSRG